MIVCKNSCGNDVITYYEMTSIIKKLAFTNVEIPYMPKIQ